jgi:hypothetical protein
MTTKQELLQENERLERELREATVKLRVKEAILVRHQEYHEESCIGGRAAEGCIVCFWNRIGTCGDVAA